MGIQLLGELDCMMRENALSGTTTKAAKETKMFGGKDTGGLRRGPKIKLQP
ncbi:MAG: hypothetical protein ACON4R_04725 [Akkermansiaceae bacterium]